MLLILVGKTCSGKTSLAEKLVSQHGFVKVVTTTSRPQRAGEKSGIHYHFRSDADFQKGLQRGEMLEHVTINGHYYGLSKAALHTGVSDARPTLAILEPVGAIAVKAYADRAGLPATTCFLTVPEDVLLTRLLQRFKTDDKADTSVYAQRLKNLLLEESRWPSMMDYDLMLPCQTLVDQQAAAQQLAGVAASRMFADQPSYNP